MMMMMIIIIIIMGISVESTDGLLLHWFEVELEFGIVVFCRGRKIGVPGEKPLGAGTRTNNKLNCNLHMTPRPGIEPGPHWWEASTLTIAPSLLPGSITPPWLKHPNISFCQSVILCLSTETNFAKNIFFFFQGVF